MLKWVVSRVRCKPNLADKETVESTRPSSGKLSAQVKDLGQSQ
jgi:hypothetical protein